MARSVWKSAHRERDVVCQECGEVFSTHGTNAKYCPVCAPIKLAEVQHVDSRYVRIGSQSHNWDTLHYEVVADPSGDFRVGARFGRDAVLASLRLGTWPVGMQLRHLRNKKVSVVAGGVGMRQGLREMGA